MFTFPERLPKNLMSLTLFHYHKAAFALDYQLVQFCAVFQHRFMRKRSTILLAQRYKDVMKPAEKAALPNPFRCDLSVTFQSGLAVSRRLFLTLQRLRVKLAGRTSTMMSASRKAASEMAALFIIKFEPSLTSRHIEGRAIDMQISWTGKIVVKDASGNRAELAAPANGSENQTLHQIGASYGVFKFLSDPPHWSSDGL